MDNKNKESLVATLSLVATILWLVALIFLGALWLTTLIPVSYWTAVSAVAFIKIVTWS